jgi:hypothetical protein
VALTDAEPVAVDFEELARRRQALALDAAEGVDGAAAELAVVEAAIADAGRAREWAELASAERALRERQAAEEAARVARDAAMLEARHWQARRERLCVAIDAAAAEWAALVAEWLAVGEEQSGALRAAQSGSWRMWHVSDGRLDRALAHALMAADVPAGALALMPLNGAPRPLADLDPVPVAPLENEIEEEAGHDGVAAA